MSRFLLIFSTILFLSSCKKDDPQAAGERYCDCMKSAAKDHSFLPDCERMGRELQKKYPEGSEGHSTIQSIMLYCGKE